MIHKKSAETAWFLRMRAITSSLSLHSQEENHEQGLVVYQFEIS